MSGRMVHKRIAVCHHHGKLTFLLRGRCPLEQLNSLRFRPKATLCLPGTFHPDSRPPRLTPIPKETDQRHNGEGEEAGRSGDVSS